jgi:hypothetical protein
MGSSQVGDAEAGGADLTFATAVDSRDLAARASPRHTVLSIAASEIQRNDASPEKKFTNGR